MNRLLFYLRYALRSLRRDGTRSFLAGLSVAFGILSLIAMQLLANTLLHGAMFDLRMQYGGDMQIHTENSGDDFTEADLAQIEAWHEQGLIADYTLISNGSAFYLATPTNGRVSILINALGIDPTNYPLVGDLVLREPSGANAADVLQNPTDVLVTRDIADERGLHIGDTVLLSGDGEPFEMTVAGIVGATPTQLGSSIFYSLDTARLIENRAQVVNMIAATWGTAANAEQTVIDSPFRVFTAGDRESLLQSSRGTTLFDVMLKGAGVLGLLIGGISVSNTLQVILARRKLEIAMLKTLGYQRADLLTLIGLETGIIGLIGGVVGALVGAQIAGTLLDVLSSVGSIMLDWRPDPLIVVSGVLIGVLTAVVFGMQAILVSSETRPVQLLRELPLKVSRRTQIGRWMLYLAMMIVFGVLVGIVVGTPLEGIAYVLVGGVVLIVLRAVFWVVLWVMLKLPLPPFPMLRLARANLRQRKMQASLAVLALFAGAFSVSFAALVIYNAQSMVREQRGSDEGFNLMVYTTTASAADAVNHIVAQGAQDTYVAERVRGLVDMMGMVIEGRDAADLNKDMQYEGEWAEDQAVALLPDYFTENYAVGDTLTLDINGQERELTLVGFYMVDWNSIGALQGAGMIVPRRLIHEFSDVQIQTLVFGVFPINSLNEITMVLGQNLAGALVFSRADINDTMITTFQALFTFAASIAGLAFVAGAVLIANSAGLTVVERYREIGVFKAVGFTSGHVLRSLLSEYGFLGVVAGLFGIAGAATAIIVMNIALSINLTIEPLILTTMLLFSVSIAVVSAAVVAWQPTRVRPLDVLRYE